MGQQKLLRLYAFLVLLSALMVATAVVGGHGGTSSSGEPVPPSLRVDRIAYVGLDGQIRTVDRDGFGETIISRGDGFFTWPTWSPDGRKLVFSGMIDNGAGVPQPVLYALNTLSGRLRELHVGELGTRSLVADGAPHYPFWSPDGTRLAFVGATGQGLVLYLDDLRDGAGPKLTLENGPLWMDWSPESRSLLVHRGPDHFLVDVENGVPTDLPVLSDEFGYRVPAWTPLGETFTFVSGDRLHGYALLTSSAAGGNRTLVENVPRDTAFLWSPDGSFIAVTRPETVYVYQPFGLRVFERVSLYSADGSSLVADIRENVIAFFWSPDSTKLAYVTLTDAPGVLRWNVFEVEDGSWRPLADFRPSLDQLTVLQFFDQYAHSHSLWSPDSDALVFAGRLPGGAVPASWRQPQVDHVIVLTTGQLPSVDVIADGVLAFWTPR